MTNSVEEINKEMNDEIKKLETNLASIIPVLTDEVDSELKAQLETLMLAIHSYLDSKINSVDESDKNVEDADEEEDEEADANLIDVFKSTMEFCKNNNLLDKNVQRSVNRSAENLQEQFAEFFRTLFNLLDRLVSYLSRSDKTMSYTFGAQTLVGRNHFLSPLTKMEHISLEKSFNEFEKACNELIPPEEDNNQTFNHK